MNFKNHLAAAIAAALVFTAHAAPRWDDKTLAAARAKAEADIDQYLQKGSGPVAKLANDDIRTWLASAKYSKVKKGAPDTKTYARLQNPAELLGKLIDRSNSSGDNAQETAYRALLAASADVRGSQTAHLDDTLALYEAIMQDDSDSIPFAIAALDKLRDQYNDEQRKQYNYLRERYAFNLSNIDSDNNQDKPRICLEFNNPVLAEPLQNWKQYISVTPAPEGEGRYAGDKLCYTGQWQTEYTFKIDPKLAAQNHMELGTAVERTINTGDRAPLVRFATRGKTLELTPDAALTIETANTDGKINVELWQIPGNNLAGDAHNAIDNPDSFEEYDLNDNASLIWKGSFEPEKSERNAITQSRLAFKDMAGDDARAGVYVLSVRDDDSSQSALLGFTVTDQGLTAYQTRDGILAELRDLKTSAPVAHQKVTLYAQNNRILSEAETDGHGIARFTRAQTSGKDADAPSHIISQKEHHLAYLRVAGQGIDLSDKGANGDKQANPTLDHWTWHDRGAYRPKDTINALWLFKTPDGKAFSDTPLWLDIYRPDGTLVHSQLLEADASGAYRYSAEIPATARLGNWNIRISLGKGGTTVVDETYLVDSIVPQQIENTLAVKAEENKAELDYSADWLYGAPAANLLTDGQWNITNDDFAKTHDEWTGWQIGRHDEAELSGNKQKIENGDTDKDGKRRIIIGALDRPAGTRPQALYAEVRLTAPDGSTISANQTAPLPRTAPYIALKAGENGAQIAAIDDKGAQQADTLEWTLYRVERNWYWYNSEGEWKYENNDSREPLKKGSLNTDGKTPANLDLPFDGDGIYVLEVRGKTPASAASLEIARGWYGDPNQNSPATITLATNQPTYKKGDTLTVNVQAPFDGKATVKVASRDTIAENHELELKNGKGQIQIPWQDNWEQGVWLLANAWNDNARDHNRRAVGLYWVGADLADRRLVPQLKLPENPQPEQPYTVGVHVPEAGDNTWVNLAIIDDGLYQIAAPSFTDPLEAFFGKKQPTLALYDTFGSIIRQTDARLATLRSGADGGAASERAALADLPDLDIDLISAWSGPLKVDADGNVNYTMPVPHYNGRLRIMAAAYNADKTGTAEETAIIKAPVVAELHTPRYLSADDSGVFTLRLHNTTDKAQNLKINLSTDNLELAGEAIPETTLEPDQTVTLSYPYRVTASGDAHIKAEISGDNTQSLERRIPIRAAALPQVRTQYQRLDGGATLEYSDLRDARLSLNSGIPYNPTPYQQQLADYPLGCSEQTTGKLWGLIGAEKADRDAIRAAENRLANLAHWDGSYSLWGYGKENRWLTAYIGEALIQLQKRQELLNPSQLTRLLGQLRSGNDGSYRPETAHEDSYAYYTLAYAEEPIRGNLLRYHREAGDQLSLSDSLDIATALALLGEYQTASERLAGGSTDDDAATYAYGSATSLAAHNLVRLKQLEVLWQNISNDPQQTQKTISRLRDIERDKLATALAHDRYHSTQELAWLVRLAALAPKLAADTPIEINGKKATLADLEKGEYNGAVRITNPGKDALWLDAQDLHTPPADKADNNGWEITLRYEDANGTVLDPAKLPNNTDISITATFTPKLADNSGSQSDLIYTYPIPAGIKLSALRDNPNDAGGDDEDDSVMRYQYRENRDDRHIAAFTAYGTPQPFSYTIYGRTTGAGTWHAPGASLENMYRPEEHARQAAQTINIQ